jgi:hypothetical protein
VNLRMVIPVELAVIGLLGAAYYGYHAVQGPEPEARPTGSQAASAKPTPSPAPVIKTTRLVSKQGKFAVGVPEDVSAKKVPPAVTMTTADKTLHVAIGPVPAAKLAAINKALMRNLKQSYSDVRTTRSESEDVDGHKATQTYGRALNDKKVPISFVNVVVKSKTRNYVISAFTGGGSDPTFVVPRVNAVINTFEVLE